MPIRLWSSCAYASVLAAASACNGAPATPRPESPQAKEPPRTLASGEPQAPAAHGELQAERLAMVREQIEARGVSDPLVLAAMREVPRHRFVDAGMQSRAYDDRPLPIAADQTISQPYIVALMSELAGISSGDRVLEVGTGSGYQAAVLAAMGAEVYSIEIVDQLARSAGELLHKLGYRVVVRSGDGYAGWPEHAPFDAILVTAAPPAIPEPLKQQLAVHGRLVVPVGRNYQDLVVLTRTEDGYERRSVIPVRFVPMTGEAQRH
jgi:protein-L-isoaspartate(D-aspartate) O-methyltransferase